MDAQEPLASTSDSAFDVAPLRSSQGSTSGRRVWDDDESQALHEIVAQASSPVNWEDVVAILGARFPDRSLRSAAQCKNRIGNSRRPQHQLQSQVRSAWTADQLAELTHAVESYKLHEEKFNLSAKDWITIAARLGPSRTAKECRKAYERQTRWDAAEQSDEEYRLDGSDSTSPPAPSRRSAPAGHQGGSSNGPTSTFRWSAEEEAMLRDFMGSRRTLSVPESEQLAHKLETELPFDLDRPKRTARACRDKAGRLFPSPSLPKDVASALEELPSRSRLASQSTRSTSSPYVSWVTSPAPTSVEEKPWTTVDDLELLRLNSVYPECYNKIARAMVPERLKDEVKDRLNRLNALRDAYSNSNSALPSSTDSQADDSSKKPSPVAAVDRPSPKRARCDPLPVSHPPAHDSAPDSSSGSRTSEEKQGSRRRKVAYVLHRTTKTDRDLRSEQSNPPPDRNGTLEQALEALEVLKTWKSFL